MSEPQTDNLDELRADRTAIADMVLSETLEHLARSYTAATDALVIMASGADGRRTLDAYDIGQVIGRLGGIAESVKLSLEDLQKEGVVPHRERGDEDGELQAVEKLAAVRAVLRAHDERMQEGDK